MDCLSRLKTYNFVFISYISPIMKRFYLTGYMGAGKTTLGKLVAELLNMEFIDLDHYIEARYHKTIRAIFAEHGEAYFRELEQKILHEVSDFENVIISTGGGVPCFFDNATYMNRHGVSVYLKVTPQRLFERLKIARQNRPVIRDKNDAELIEFIRENLDKRQPYYEQATIIFDATDLESADQVEQAANSLSAILSNY